LRGSVGACSIEIAYQAAEANHPNQGRAGSPLTKDTSQTWPASQAEAAKNPIGKASPQETLAETYRSRQPKSAVAVSRAEGLSVWNRCLALKSHHSSSGHSPRGPWRQAIVEGADQNAAMHRARKVHPLLTRRGYAHVVAGCVREHCSPGRSRGSIDKRNAFYRSTSCLSGMSGRERDTQRRQRWKS